LKEEMMSDESQATESAKIEQDRQSILEAQKKGTGAKLLTYSKLSGPGWLQGAITLGGGSLGGSLYLGIIGGYDMLWLQPLMMIFGIVMLSAIGYVALSTQKRPFQQINDHINPVLGWGWAIATLMANLVWAMPQFSLGTAALQQNLGLFTGENGKFIAAGVLFVVAGVVIWFYDSGGWGIKAFEMLLKIMVGIIVLCFVGVVVAMAGSLPWSEIFTGFIPNPKMLFSPADAFTKVIGESAASDYWEGVILKSQRDKMVTAAATAVGINMTFLLPYSMLKRKWSKDFRGLATFDLSTGLFIPFFLATSCVLIASASQFHGKYDLGLLEEGPRTKATEKLEGAYRGNLDGRVKDNQALMLQFGAEPLGKLKADNTAYTKALAKHDGDEKKLTIDLGKDAYGALKDKKVHQEALALPDKQLAAMLVNRDSGVLASSLENLAGKPMAQTVFGIGVVGMAISTIIILMLINGFTVCELLNMPSKGVLHRIGCYMPGITGALGALYLWTGQAKFWLVQPTSIFGMALLPIASITFFFMMNNRSILGEHMPKGGKRLAWNCLMLVGLVLSSIGAGWAIWGRTLTVPGTDLKVRWVAMAIFGGFVLLALIVHFVRPPKKIDHNAVADSDGAGG
jgi:Mn2+/Fe2+ NRAMP family transporter